MRSGITVRRKSEGNIGVLTTVIGNVGIVSFGSYSIKYRLSELVEVGKPIVKKDFEEIYYSLIGEIGTLMPDAPIDEVSKAISLLGQFGVILSKTLFDNNEN